MIDLKATGVDAALATADRLINQDRQFTELRALKGDIYMAANRAVDAIQAYQEANNAAPTTALAMRVAGAMVRAGRTADATKYLQDWNKVHPDDLGDEATIVGNHHRNGQFPRGDREPRSRS